MATKKIDYVEYVSDFETTVDEEDAENPDAIQESTEVWAAATVALNVPDDPKCVEIQTSINEWFAFIERKLYSENVKVYFHNLRFDGSFIIDYLLHSDYKPAGEKKGCKLYLHQGDLRDLLNEQYTYNISAKGLWYSITFKKHGHLCTIWDSLKLLPFSVKDIGKGFGTKHRKLEMEYMGNRRAGGTITKEEKDYIKNDVLVVKEGLNFLKSEGFNSMTIGACCLKEFKKYYTKNDWDLLYPNLYSMPIGGVDEPETTIGDYIRESYHGGWCYVVPEKAGKDYYNGTTADVNSLYPSMMHSESGNVFPVGSPTYFKGNIPDEALRPDRYYFVRVKTRFYIKHNMLPTIQIKGSMVYPPREWLKTSDVYNTKNGKYFRTYIDIDGEEVPAIPTLTLTQTDWELMKEHYDLEDTEIIDGFYFNAISGIFDDYINKFAEIKMREKGPRRQVAKLALNSLYGKMATSCDSSYKVCYLNDKGELRTYEVYASDKVPGYIPIGSAITAYARRFTITAAQKNYNGPDKPGFIYADTDSISCDIKPDDIKGAPEHPTKFNCWKYEACWDYAKFVRPKTYVKHITHDNREPIDPFFDLKCAGMPDFAKRLMIMSVKYDLEDLRSVKRNDKIMDDILIGKNLSDDEIKFINGLGSKEFEFVTVHRTWDDFDIGLVVPGVLKAKFIKGGTLLCKGFYIMRPQP